MNKPSPTIAPSVPILNDEEIEAQVFRDLEAARKLERDQDDQYVILFQYPDSRTVFQRLQAYASTVLMPKMNGHLTRQDKGLDGYGSAQQQRADNNCERSLLRS